MSGILIFELKEKKEKFQEGKKKRKGNEIRSAIGREVKGGKIRRDAAKTKVARPSNLLILRPHIVSESVA